jgi:hypothetical protein
MTKRRDPFTFHRALTVVAARIGWDRCAMITGRSERQVRNWSDPDADSEISILDALRLDKAFLAADGDHAPFGQVYNALLDIAGAETDTDLVQAAADAAKESGEAVSALLEAATTNNPDHRRRARKEAEEALGAITRGLAALDAREAKG